MVIEVLSSEPRVEGVSACIGEVQARVTQNVTF